ncbi:MAG: hypothetical protein ABI778_08870 [Ignavibacteriota bacterium]
MFEKGKVLVCILFPLLCGCKEVGFRKIEGANEKATVQSAQEALQEIELALNKYKEINRTYPRITEAALYDSLRNYFVIPIDPNHLYRDEATQTNYIAIGARKNKIVYRYPATLGTGDYTLYWVGTNGNDEQGRGDDLFASKGKAPKQLSRKLLLGFRGDSVKTEFSLSASGGDFTKDSVKFQIRAANTLLYSDWWPLGTYVVGRPELSEAERQETVNLEFERFLYPAHFVLADSILGSRKYSAINRALGGGTLSTLAKKNLQVFTYYSGPAGSKVLYWNGQQRKINVATLSDR